MAHAAHAHDPNKYYIPHGSNLPFFGSVSLFVLMAGAALFLSGVGGGGWILLVGLVLLAALFFLWFGTVISENQAGIYNMQVDRSFRMGMMWFIFSEVMFFAAFFGALFYARQLSLPWLGGDGGKAVTSLLHPGFEATWPYGANGPAALGPNEGGEFEVMHAWGLPALNTALLLTSGVTITVAHHALKENKRGILNVFLALTFILGFIFLGVQAYEYHHAWTELGLQLGTGVYGSTFFMLTGFHGLHVTVGAIMLLVIWLRCLKGHFTPERHFAFEGVAWYWHFVDVVWLGLFVFVYWL
ncbi:MAG: MFS transporter [Gammaproteobacteria bacterium SG8_30]|jgi:cytochrome c oxidase subunit 3|nr:MAG: MFS transporter [Gammaproteobacteria bacterium SG8_30]